MLNAGANGSQEFDEYYLKIAFQRAVSMIVSLNFAINEMSQGADYRAFSTSEPYLTLKAKTLI